MCRYMRLPIAFRDNQQISLADSTDGAIDQLHTLHISKGVSWMLRIPVLFVSCQEAMTLMIKPCALIPNLVHMCCTLVPEMLCHPSHGTDCPNSVRRSCNSHWDLIACIIGYLNFDLTDIRYETASGGEHLNLEVLAQTRWILATCWYIPSKRSLRC